MGKLLAIANKNASKAPMILFDNANVNEKTGVENDFRGQSLNRQVTVVSQEAWDNACSDLGQEVSWTLRRANLLVSGIDLENSKNQYLRINDVILQITGETKPCSRMEQQCEGLQNALTPEWRAGVTCSVVKGGNIKNGDVVEKMEDIDE